MHFSGEIFIIPDFALLLLQLKPTEKKFILGLLVFANFHELKLFLAPSVFHRELSPVFDDFWQSSMVFVLLHNPYFVSFHALPQVVLVKSLEANELSFDLKRLFELLGDFIIVL